MTPIETDYANTDFDLRSAEAFDLLDTELSAACCKLHYTQAEDGSWWASYEADRLNDSAANDINAFIEVFDKLTDAAKQQFANCASRDFNIGIHCWDTWAYYLTLPQEIVVAAATAGCSISVTLYPMRKLDGTPKFDEDAG